LLPVLEHKKHLANFGAHFHHQAHLLQRVKEVNLRRPEVPATSSRTVKNPNVYSTKIIKTT
jgi:hypothetical protein